MIRDHLLALGFTLINYPYGNYAVYRVDLHDRSINAYVSLTNTPHVLDVVLSSRTVHFSTLEELILAWIYLSLTSLRET